MRGEQDYTRILEWAAKSAAELDTYWQPLRQHLRYGGAPPATAPGSRSTKRPA